jgi:deferrochelatase/peroxidase EfeB
MRRANPRDTRFPGSQDEIDATNRHRLLRVGRAYENAGGEQGLLFMCLNADIERQFEFVQRTWLLNPQMHGLQDEMDPLLAPGAHRFTIPTGYGPVGLPDLPQLVTVVGGGYFFLPSRTALRFLARLRDSEPMLDRVPEPVEPDLAAEARPHADGLVRERAPDP